MKQKLIQMAAAMLPMLPLLSACSIGASGQLSMPGDISIMGFDNLPECRYSNPKLTTISQNLPRKAQLVGAVLFRMIRDEPVATTEVIDVEIIERPPVRELRQG